MEPVAGSSNALTKHDPSCHHPCLSTSTKRRHDAAMRTAENPHPQSRCHKALELMRPFLFIVQIRKISHTKKGRQQ
jgi:hypothetical protein